MLAAKQFWVGVDDPETELPSLASGAWRAANRAHIMAAGGPFAAHLTLARFREPTDATDLITALAGFNSELWPVTEICLLESELGNGVGGHSRYRVTDRFALTGS